MKLWLCVDPGETTGFSIWGAGDLIYADQLPMWAFIDAVEDWCAVKQRGEALGGPGGDAVEPLGAMVVEQWQLYPWKIKDLAFDECRTARAIGALTHICRRYGVKLIFQGADIKEGAKQAGAENLFLEPPHENRHANDATMHGVYWLAIHHGKPPTA